MEREVLVRVYRRGSLVSIALLLIGVVLVLALYRGCIGGCTGLSETRDRLGTELFTRILSRDYPQLPLVLGVLVLLATPLASVVVGILYSITERDLRALVLQLVVALLMVFITVVL